MVRIKNPKKLKSIIAREGYSQSAFSRNIGYERSYINKILKRGTLSAKSAKIISDTLKIRFNILFF